MTEADELAAEQAVNEFVKIIHEQRAEIRSLKDQLVRSSENELFRIKESNRLAHENADLRKQNAQYSNSNEAYRLLVVDCEAMFSTLFPRLTATVQRADRITPLSSRPPIRMAAS